MSIDAQIVTNESNEADIANAIRHNGQMVQEAAVTETAVLTEQKHVHAQAAEQGGSGILGRADSAGGSLKEAGANRFSVGVDTALDAAGLGGLGQMVKTAIDMAEDYKDPHAHSAGRTFDDIITNGASPQKESSIFTGRFNKTAAIPGRAQGVNDFMQGSDTKGVKTTESTTAALSKQLEQTISAKVLSSLHLGNAKAQEAKHGAKIAKARMAGIPQQALTNSGMGSGPKGYVEPKEEIVDESATSWA